MDLGWFVIPTWVLLWACDVALRFVILGWPRVSDAAGNYRGGTGIFLFPGVLAEAVNQFAPVREALQPFGRLFYANFDLTRAIFSPWRNKRVFAKRIAQLDTKYQFDQKVFAGCSMGAGVALDVRDEMHRRNPTDLRKPGLIVFDGVGGSENLLSGGNIGGPVMTYLRWLPIGFFAGLLVSSVVTVVQSLFINQLPKDAEIEVGLDIEAVKAKAKRDMSWYQTAVFLRQLAYMHRNRVTPERLARFAWIVYFEYTDHNVTLSQPAERNKWSQMAHQAGVPFANWSIDAPHVAFAQMPELNKKMILQGLEMFPSKLRPEQHK